ncbi:stonustoxin subunit beta-like [Fundulus heteroclitus]|uniref:stonustoxin subunit beta-like n=1 Tax=Fundulus heteroclitus TaxID=8078 RepID=UPI00165B0D37|nr:stonustoxin subunit beta-like [Fundulus heteroclitus]
MTPGLRKYSCQLTIDPETVNQELQLSDNNKKVTYMEEEEAFPDHPERFDSRWPQLLCTDALSGRCYWEVKWSGIVYISVSYRRTERKENNEKSVFGWNDQSWSLECSNLGYAVWHNDEKTSITSSSPNSLLSFMTSSFSVTWKVAVYVDCDAGILSFYKVLSGKPIHLHTFNTTFKEPLYPGFTVWPGSSVCLL